MLALYLPGISYSYIVLPLLGDLVLIGDGGDSIRLVVHVKPARIGQCGQAAGQTASFGRPESFVGYIRIRGQGLRNNRMGMGSWLLVA